MEAEDLAVWHVNVVGAPGTLYAGERYRIRCTFGERWVCASVCVCSCCARAGGWCARHAFAGGGRLCRLCVTQATRTQVPD